MLYAIVDIETNGSVHQGGGIMEIAILVSDGERVIDRYETLVNPQGPIPPFIQSLTGIRPHMVAQAPIFEQVAPQIFHWLKDKIFVAHNVSFDFPFVHQLLGRCGFPLEVPRVCTVRLGRQVLPGMKSYSLGKICRELGIAMEKGHRAGEDAMATAALFHLLKSRDQEGRLEAMIHPGVTVPPPSKTYHVRQRHRIPETKGVFYCLNRDQQVIFLSRSNNIQERVRQFFDEKANAEPYGWINKLTHKIRIQPLATSLMAKIQEAADMAELRPVFNRNSTRLRPRVGLFKYQDRRGYDRLGIQKLGAGDVPISTFNTHRQAEKWLELMARDFGLCSRHCQLSVPLCPDKKGCLDPDCPSNSGPGSYNQRVRKAIGWIQAEPPSFAFIDEGRRQGEHSFLLMKKGVFLGMGYVKSAPHGWSWEDLEEKAERLPHTEYIRAMVLDQARLYPEKCLIFP